MQWCIDMLALFPLIIILLDLSENEMQFSNDLALFKCREKLSLNTSFHDS